MKNKEQIRENVESNKIMTEVKPVIDILNVLFKDIKNEQSHEKRFQLIQQLECFTRTLDRFNLTNNY